MPNTTLYRVAILFLSGVAVCVFDSTRPKESRPSPSDIGSASSAEDHGGTVRLPTQAQSQPFIPQILPEIVLPPLYDFLANSTDDGTTQDTIPVIWSLPRSGGATVSAILGECHGLVLAGEWHESPEAGALPSDEKLNIVNELGRKQVTVDLSTETGRQRAKQTGLTNMAEVLISHDLIQTSAIFTSYGPQGMLWTWFRHPIQRQASLFAYLTSLPEDDPEYNPKLSVYGIADFARSRFHESNPMIKSLLGKPLSESIGWSVADLHIAKELVRQKANIGLLEAKGESLRRILRSVGKTSSSERACLERLLEWAWPNKNRHGDVEENSEAYQVLHQRNWLDMELYHYAAYLFAQEGR